MELQQDLVEKFERSRDLTKSLETLFNKDSDGNIRDFGELAEKNPDIVTEELNTGTREVFECFEQLSKNTSENNGEQKYIDCFPND